MPIFWKNIDISQKNIASIGLSRRGEGMDLSYNPFWNKKGPVVPLTTSPLAILDVIFLS
jgi:hypothetical protein